MAEPPLRLLNFVSASELGDEQESSKAPQQNEVYDSRPLYQILKENQDKKDEEFNERFKHRPPKALDEDETEFLEALETTAIASRVIAAEEVKSVAATTPPLEAQKPKVVGKRLQPKSTMPSFIRIKPQPKKAKLEVPVAVTSKQQDQAEEVVQKSTILGLVSYSDESDDED